MYATQVREVPVQRPAMAVCHIIARGAFRKSVGFKHGMKRERRMTIRKVFVGVYM